MTKKQWDKLTKEQQEKCLNCFATYMILWESNNPLPKLPKFIDEPKEKI